MLIDISEKDYKNYFAQDPNPFVSEGFINLTKQKVDKVVRLVDSGKDVCIGLVAGLKGSTLLAPFSAPFGGFHYKYEAIFYECDEFIYPDTMRERKQLLEEKSDAFVITVGGREIFKIRFYKSFNHINSIQNIFFRYRTRKDGKSVVAFFLNNYQKSVP